jgi:hypothetical protein
VLGWGTIVGLILLPAIAMQFTRDVQWTAADFAFAILMLGGVGAAFEMAVRATPSGAYRGGAAIALGAGLLLLWANGAVGIVGDEGQRINLWFDLIPLLALFGAIGARFRSRGMAALWPLHLGGDADLVGSLAVLRLAVPQIGDGW